MVAQPAPASVVSLVRISPRDSRGIVSPDAKRIVHESRAWADRRENDDQFHDALEAEFRAEASGG